MAQNITIMGASYSDVPAVTLPKTGGGTAIFYDAEDGNNIGYGLTDGSLPLVGVAKVGSAEI